MFLRKSIPALSAACLAISILVSGCGPGTDNKAQNGNANSIGTPAASTPAASQNAAPKNKLNVNTATKEEFLGTIPGFGNKMAHEFEEYRPYRSIQQFRKEIGKYVSPDVVAEYEKYIFVPIDVNQADAATLQQIPGLDANEIQQLISGRPYASHDTFLTKFTPMVSADDLAIANKYLVHQ